MRPNEFEIDGGAIIVQSCADDWAHIWIYLRGRITAHHIAVPSLVREWRIVYYNDEVKPAEFDEILQKNKSRLLEVIQQLNAAEQSVQWMVGDSPRQLSFI